MGGSVADHDASGHVEQLEGVVGHRERARRLNGGDEGIGLSDAVDRPAGSARDDQIVE